MTTTPATATEPRREGRFLLSDARTTLIVSPNGGTAGEVSAELQRRGHPTLMATRALEALYWIREIPPIVVIVDMRSEGARILIPELRRQGREIVALSDDSSERQEALENGCIQAHRASTTAKELAQLIAALVRGRDVRRIGTIEAGPLLVDLSEAQLVFEGRPIAVSALLLDLAAHLAARAGRFVPVSVLLREVWGEPWADPAKVHLAVHRLRTRLGLSPHSRTIASQRGHGYGVLPGVASANLRHASRRG